MDDALVTDPACGDALVVRLERTAVAAERRGNVISVADPLVAFSMLLDLERRRRAGGTIPAVRLELPGGADDRLEAALARHLPWVEVAPPGSCTEAPAASSAATGTKPPPASTVAPRRTDESSMAPLVTAAELAMLFGERRP